jgi:hypothetical protein
MMSLSVASEAGTFYGRSQERGAAMAVILVDFIFLPFSTVTTVFFGILIDTALSPGIFARLIIISLVTSSFIKSSLDRPRRAAERKARAASFEKEITKRPGLIERNNNSSHNVAHINNMCPKFFSLYGIRCCVGKLFWSQREKGRVLSLCEVGSSDEGDYITLRRHLPTRRDEKQQKV